MDGHSCAEPAWSGEGEPPATEGEAEAAVDSAPPLRFSGTEGLRIRFGLRVPAGGR